MAGSLTVTLELNVHGPLADGTASRTISDATKAAAKDLAETGQTIVRVAAESMDRSGRGGTGRASGGVKLEATSGAYRVYGGIRQGEYAWPWLEGTSRRNRTTRFRGYRTFAKTARQLDQVAAGVLERHIAEIMPQIGGQ